MGKKYFPIRTETACRTKWTNSTLYLNSGITSSCHRSADSPLTIDSFDNFHNTDEKLKHRRVMLNGQWPGGGCEYCRTIEASGGFSDRMFQNSIPDVYPTELDNDPAAVNVTARTVEVLFTNTCNLRCVYCSAEYSSAIQLEDKKHGGPIIPLSKEIEVSNNYHRLIPKFWNWFIKNSSSLLRLQILGGEPFLLHDVDKLIEYFESNPCPDIEFNLISNLAVSESLFAKKIDKLVKLVRQQKIKRFDLLASIDSWGAGQEYTRYGLQQEVFESNLKLAQQQEIRLGLLTTVNVLSINEMPELCRKFLDWNKQQPLYWYMHFPLPFNEHVVDPTNFSYSLFERSLLEIESLLPNVSWEEQQTFKTFMGIKNTLQKDCNNNSSNQKKLFNYLDQIDTRRGTDWRTIFSWLAEVEKHVV